IDKFNELNIYV
ncbi:hypothetical protein MK338_11740, partial [Streptococcus vestibularis]|nr:hypothetical protein [Streptococcus vestibularis]